MRECELFVQACELEDPTQREEFLDRACGGDVDLRRRVDRLMGSRETLDDFMEPVDSRKLESDGLDRVGQELGPYVLRELIGEGGFGVVYVAEQRKPISRKVAIKLIKPGMDSQEIVARFEAERQVLAMMDHPNIARVLDAGTSSEGHPYFVMELVPGVPITDYTATHQVPLRERLALMKSVCEAVEHAHKKGIIHRDLKPSNVLITLHDGKPVVKIIDFGVAKALHGQLTDRTVYTAMGQLLGTPMYMSPEQAELSGLDIDTRSDVYSLGVLLYELLTGLTPFDRESFKQVGLTDRLRMIREHEPLRPSLRVSTAAIAAERTHIDDRRQIDARRLSGSLKGELDWIVMKAIEKNRERRFDSARAFADDIDCFLQDRPVQAGPPSAWYRARKFAQRHRSGLMLGSVLALLCLTVMLVAGWTVRDRIAHRQRLSREINSVLVEADRLLINADWRDAQTLLDRAEFLIEDSDVERDLRQRITRLVDDVELVKRLEEARRTLDPGHSKESDQTYAAAFRDIGVDMEEMSPAQAAAYLRPRVSIRPYIISGLDRWALASAGPDAYSDNETWRRILKVARLLDSDPLRNQLREKMASKSLDYFGKELKKEQIATLEQQPVETRVLLSRCLNIAGRKREAIDVLRNAARSDPADFDVNFDLAMFLYDRNESDSEALRFFTAARALRPNEPVVHHNISVVLFARGQYRAAAESSKKAIRLKPDYISPHQTLVHSLLKLKRAEEAKQLAQRVLKLHSENAKAHNLLGIVLSELREFEKASLHLGKSIALAPDNAVFRANQGTLYRRQGKPEAAIEAFQKAIEGEPNSAKYYTALSGALFQAKRFDEAIEVVSKAIQLDPLSVEAYAALGAILAVNGDYDGAVRSLEKARAIDPENADVVYKLGQAAHRRGNRERAEVLFRKATELAPDDILARVSLGITLTEQRRFEPAREAFEAALLADPDHLLALLNLAKMTTARGDYRAAADLYQEAIEKHPHDLRLLFLAAGNALQLGDHERAIEYLRKIVKDDLQGRREEHLVAMNTLARLLSVDPAPKKGDYTEAVKWAQRVVELGPERGSFWNTLAVANLRAKRWEEAIEAASRSRQLDEKNFAIDSFVTAIAKHHLGDRDASQLWHDKGVAWVEDNGFQNDEMSLFRDQSANLIQEEAD